MEEIWKVIQKFEVTTFSLPIIVIIEKKNQIKSKLRMDSFKYDPRFFFQHHTIQVKDANYQVKDFMQ